MTAADISLRDARQDLYEVIREDAPFERKARKALALGKRFLGVENGHLTRIDRKTDHWETAVSTDEDEGQFPEGMELELGQTYCRRTLEAEAAVALHDAPEQGWGDDPAFEAHGLHCYHGTTLKLQNDLYGTVCFVAADPRRTSFSDEETLFAELITRLLERELERERHEAELTRQANLATVLNRVLRHNLRNDMAVIRGYTQQLVAGTDQEAAGEVALSHIDELLALSRKARELDRVVASELDARSAEIGGLVEGAADSVAADHPAATVSVDSEAPVTASVLPSFDRAVEELVENAVKHGGSSPTVAVTVETVPNAVEIRVRDDGPGIDDHEAAVLETGAETPLTHGSGLGLWLAHWIVSSHDGTIEATATDDGTTMTVTLPRRSRTNPKERLSELVRARDQYQAAFEEALDAMVLLDDDARIVDANAAAARLFAVSQQELLGRPLAEFVPEECDFESAWSAFLQRGEKSDTVPISDEGNDERRVEYAAAADVVPGQHFVVNRTASRVRE